MCYRLLVASACAPELPELEALAAAQGLDIRTAAAGGALGYLEIAWGDCACSLYTRKDGRERAVGFVEALWSRGLQPQLLLFRDDMELALEESPPVQVPLEAFRQQGLQALPEGKVAVLTTSVALPRPLPRSR